MDTIRRSMATMRRSMAAMRRSGVGGNSLDVDAAGVR